MTMENFRKLQVWQKAHKLVLEVYRLTRFFPNEERFGLTTQIRRAAISIASNIAEGSKRKTSKDRLHFNVMADGSLEEVKYYIILAYELQYLKLEQGRLLMEEAREVGKMLFGFSKSLA